MALVRVVHLTADLMLLHQSLATAQVTDPFHCVQVTVTDGSRVATATAVIQTRAVAGWL